MRRPVSILLSILFALSLMATATLSSATQARTHHRAPAHGAAKTAARSAGKSSARPAAKTVSKSSPRAHAAHEPKGRRESKASPRSRSASSHSAASRSRSRSLHRTVYRKHGRYANRAVLDDPQPEIRAARLGMPAPLRGSHESLVHQNEMAEADGLERILDDADLDDRIQHGSLVPVPVSADLHINQNLPENRRYCRPWTARFLTVLAQAHAAKFPGAPREVTSAVRTVEYQRQLRRVNGNAAAADGDIASPHLTGGTFDIGKTGMSPSEVGWLRGFLLPLEQAGKIDVEEEFKQSCFHISVYKSYIEPKAPSHAKPSAPVIASPDSAATVLPAARGR